MISALLDIDADKGGGGEGKNGHDNDGVLLSWIVLPSHVLVDGQFVHLPPPLALEKAAFFEWAVASYCLINVEWEEGGEGRGKTKRTGGGWSATTGGNGNGGRVHALSTSIAVQLYIVGLILTLGR